MMCSPGKCGANNFVTAGSIVQSSRFKASRSLFVVFLTRVRIFEHE